MSFHFSKLKFVSSCIRCNNYAWLDKYMPEEKSPIDDFTKSLFDNGHKIERDLEKYCALDTLAVVKILKKLYEVCK